MVPASPLPELSRLALVIAALEGSTVLAERRFGPGATVTVGSNSKNALVIDGRFELTSYTLITDGSLLHLAPPLHVQATCWVGEQVMELKGFYRDLRRQHPDLPSLLKLAGERFVVRYATGVAFLGRFISGDAGEPPGQRQPQ